MATSRVIRGRESEEAVAQWFRDSGWDGAERAPASLRGKDILGMPAFSVEVKARRELNLPAWLRQAHTRPGLPLVVHRPDGFGLNKVRIWPVTMTLEDITPLLRLWDS